RGVTGVLYELAQCETAAVVGVPPLGGQSSEPAKAGTPTTTPRGGQSFALLHPPAGGGGVVSPDGTGMAMLVAIWDSSSFFEMVSVEVAARLRSAASRSSISS